MEVCEVCGAFLIVGDAQSRVDDHLMGKQHMGYAKIKSTVEELKVTQSSSLHVFMRHIVCVLCVFGANKRQKNIIRRQNFFLF